MWALEDLNQLGTEHFRVSRVFEGNRTEERSRRLQETAGGEEAETQGCAGLWMTEGNAGAFPNRT